MAPTFSRRRHWLWVLLAVVVCCATVIGHTLPLGASSADERLAPEPQIHPLPQSLAAWEDPAQQGDYFDQIKPNGVGYLVWSEFPIQIYVSPAATSGPSATGWQQATEAAISAWQPYLPLALTQEPSSADIVIQNRKPESRSGERVRAAEANCFNLYVNELTQLDQRCTINISPQQPGTQEHRMASVRHELGHALGIWGHSPSETDALYFAQVRTPTGISARDVNTLKRIYQQPTRLGWPLPSATE